VKIIICLTTVLSPPSPFHTRLIEVERRFEVALYVRGRGAKGEKCFSLDGQLHSPPPPPALRTAWCGQRSVDVTK